VELLEHEPKINTSGGIIPGVEGAIQTKGDGEISLKNIKFHYPAKKDVEVLKGVSIDISKNRVIALVGPSGKSKFYLKFRLWKVKCHFYD
jgi:ABC-type multidrug transport system fused ATPase/permease subunit